MSRRLFAAFALLAVLSVPGVSRANCFASLGASQNEAMDIIWYPNWTKAYGASFDLSDWEGVDCGTTGCLVCHPGGGDTCGGVNLQLAALTIVNFGTATNADITNVYWASNCGGTMTWHTMTNRGAQMWTWAWNGVEANPTLVTVNKGIATYCQIQIYADIAPTPTDGATVKLGIPYDPSGFGAGISDLCCCNPTWTDTMNPVPKTIMYVAKFVDERSAAPGDTLHYTIYYGKPGVGNIQNVFIMDTQPPYTHWNGVSNPLPDPGWDPNPGPPLKLGWTVFPASTPVAGGATGRIAFQLTVDWGNGEWFEAGSGDVAGPEGYSLWNSAVATFPNIAAKVHYANKTRTTVMRFLFWKLADRDIVYNCTPTTCDEITYSIFIKNLSTTKTWWDVSIWDTCPPQTDPWYSGCGVEDSCVGWTMTPTGCAIAGAGKVLSGTNTILTWRLDMPPSMTLTLRWKARVSPAALAGQTSINKASILEYGRSAIIDGTGHSVRQRNFTHEAPVMLRTTYVSYVSYTYASCFDAGTATYWIFFYPLHPSTAFQLFRIHDTADCVTGLYPSITTLATAAPCNSWPGGPCPIGIERRPQEYGGFACANPTNDFYKLVSNAPLLWEAEPTIGETNQDSVMYSSATTISFRGKTFYTFRRTLTQANSDYLGICNTEDQETTVHLFQWQGGTLDWDYRGSRTIDPMSQWCPGGVGPLGVGHWRVISSDSSLIVHKFHYLGTDKDNTVTMAPATNGMLISRTVGDDFWIYAPPRGGFNEHQALEITNLGTADADFQLWEYMSNEVLDTVDLVPFNLGGASGTWTPMLTATVPWGQAQAAAPYNPYTFSQLYGTCNTNQNSSFQNDYGLYRVTLLSNQPIQCRPGRGRPEKYGGYVFHGLDWTGATAQTVKTFWHSVWVGAGILVAFAPAKDMVVQFTNEDGLSATYTTTGPDQPIALCNQVGLEASCMSNFKVDVLAPVGGTVIGMTNGSYFTERHYAAPFLSTGVHYEIIAPPFVFTGVSFWITVVVVNQGGGTRTNYTGTTSFSSTDPFAKIQAVAMDGYNYTWVVGDLGVKVFINVTMTTLGIINLVANDLNDGSITGVTSIMVVGADVKLEKLQKLTVAASGDTVQFRICWSNYSSATAQTFVITDAVPNGTTYVPEVASLALCGWNGPNQPTVTLATSTSTATVPSAVTFATLGAASSAPSTTRWLRWTIRDIYVYSTGCVCFKVTVN